MSVPDPRKRPGNVACESRRVKPKASLNHPGEPGEGKAGRVNANEPPLRLRYERSSQPMADATMHRPGTRPPSLVWQGVLPSPRHAGAPGPRSIGGTHPRRVSAGAERGNPVAVWPPGPVS